MLGHVDSKWTDGVDFSAGSLGMGLSFGLGSALAARLDDSVAHMGNASDGEIQEGQIGGRYGSLALEVSNLPL